METSIFNFAEESIKKNIKRMYLLTGIPLIIILPILTFVYISAQLPLIVILPTIIGTPILLSPIIFIINKTSRNSLGKLQLEIDREKVVRKNNLFVIDTVEFAQVTRIDVHRLQDGSIFMIILKTAAGKKTIGGFDNMNKVAELISERCGSQVPKNIMEKKLDPNGWIITIITIVGGLVLLAAIFFFRILFQVQFKLSSNSLLLAIMDQSIPFLGGICLMLFRPLSRFRGKQYFKFEIIIGVFLIIVSILKIVLTVIK